MAFNEKINNLVSRKRSETVRIVLRCSSPPLRSRIEAVDNVHGLFHFRRAYSWVVEYRNSEQSADKYDLHHASNRESRYGPS